MNNKGFAAIGIVIVLALAGFVYFIYSQDLKTRKFITASPSPTEESLSVAETPTPVASAKTITPKPTATVTPTPSPSPTLSPRPFAEEEPLMRKTIAGFEMYIGTSNTAGALTFFTPPVGDAAKAKLEQIRTKNLPYRLYSWKMVTDAEDRYLRTQEINGGYKIQVIECRTNGASCTGLYLELVRNDKAENYFSVERYYEDTYLYQNNLGEDIKYQGFGL